MSFFGVYFNKHIQELHDKIFKYLSSLDINRYLSFLECYIVKMRLYHVKDQHELQKALNFDSEFIIEYIDEHFDYGTMHQSKITYKYIKLLERREIKNEKIDKLKNRADTDLYKIYSVLNVDRLERVALKEKGLSFQDIEEMHKQEVSEAIKDYTIEDLKILFAKLEEDILNSGQNDKYNLKTAIVKILEVLINSRDIFFQLLNYIMDKENLLQISFHSIPFHFLMQNIDDHLRFYTSICSKEYKNRNQWIYSFFSALPDSLIDDFYIQEFEKFLEEITIDWNIFFDCFLKYDNIRNGLFIKFMSILYNNRESNNVSFSVLLNPYSDLRKEIFNYFSKDKSLIKKIYLHEIKNYISEDYDGFFLNHFLTISPDFIIEYLKTIYSENDLISDYSSHSDYTFIWGMESHELILDKAIDFILDNENYLNDSNFLNVFFQFKKSKGITQDIVRERQKTNSIDAIKAISFDYELYTGGDTFIPLFNQMLSFWEALQKKLDDLKYIEIRQYVTEQISHWRDRISDEKRNKFIGHLYY